MKRTLAPYLLSAPAAALLVGLLACPLVLLVRVSLYEPAAGRGFFTPGTWTLAGYRAVTDGHGLGLLGFTVLFGAAVAVVSVLLGYPLALFVRALSPRWRRVALAAWAGLRATQASRISRCSLSSRATGKSAWEVVSVSSTARASGSAA